MSFSDKLRELREAASLSQYELARRAGVSKQAINYLEQDSRRPSWELVQRLCLVLEVSCDVFLDPDLTVPGKQPPKPRDTVQTDEPKPPARKRGRPKGTTQAKKSERKQETAGE